jgi:hypothetical protein
MDVCVDETGHHRHRAESSVCRSRPCTGTDPINETVRDINPSGPQQLSAGQQGLGSE